MAENIESGCCVCIGITSLFPYVTSYCLEAILGSELRRDEGSTEVLEKYDFIGADDDFIYEILSYGYQHEGLGTIHKKIFYFHVTLVFKKKQL